MASEESSINVNLMSEDINPTSSTSLSSNPSNKHPNNIQYLKTCHSERHVTTKASTTGLEKSVKKSKKRKKSSLVAVVDLKESDSDSESGKTVRDESGAKENDGINNSKSTEERKDLEVKPFSVEGMTRRTKRYSFDLDAVAPMQEELTIVRRDEWGGKPPTNVTNKAHITTTILFTYSTDTKPCTTLEECCEIVRKLQKYNMYGNLPDIPFNFLVGGDGRIYEGRGWHAEPETNSKYKQLKGHYVDFAFIGDYRVERPSDAMFDAVLELIDYGRRNFWVRDQFGLIENYD